MKYYKSITIKQKKDRVALKFLRNYFSIFSLTYVLLVVTKLVFLFTYILIVDERIHRAVAAMIGAAIIVFLGIVPWENLLEYLDFGTIFLLMGMMIIVNTARNSGLFEYCHKNCQSRERESNPCPDPLLHRYCDCQRIS